MAINCFDGVNLKIGDKTLEQLFKERTSGNPSELELIEIGTDLAMQYHESLFNELETLRKAVNPKAAKGKYQNPFDKEKLNKAKEEQNKQPQKEQVKVEQPKEEPVAEPAEKQKEAKAEQPTVSETPPALRDVESTAKALEGIVKDKVKTPNDIPNTMGTHLQNITDGSWLIRDGDTSKEWVDLVNNSIKDIERIFSVVPYSGKTRDILSGIKEKVANSNYDISKEISQLSEETKKEFYKSGEGWGVNEISEAYHKAKADGSNPELVKAVEDLLKPKSLENKPTISKEQSKPNIKEEAPIEGSGVDVETKQQIENFGVNKEDVEPVHSVISQVFSGLKKAGLTAAKTVGDWVGIGKGEEKPYSLKINGKDVQVKNVQPEVVNGFYSPLEKIVNDSKFDKLPAKQWADKFAKGEEAKWTGLTDWLAQQQGSVSKADIQQYLKDNRIQVVEVVKGEDMPNYKLEVEPPSELGADRMDLLGDLGKAGNLDNPRFREYLNKKYGKNGNKIYDWLAENATVEGTYSKDTKFSEYVLKGEKSNYKEVLVTLPSRNDNLSEKEYEEFRRIDDKVYYDRTPEEQRKYVEYQNRFTKSRETNKDFKSSHFDEPNILVHLRMNTRTDAAGKKVLFLEEVQSDWGQKGKREGFKDESRIKRRKRYLELDKKAENTNLTLDEQKEYVELERLGVRQDAYPEISPLVATAPFVTDTNAWTKLGLKVALKEAVKQGADKIAWSTGTQQFDRWGSEKISWKKEGNKWKIDLKEQESGNAFEGINIDEKALSESNVSVSAKEQLRVVLDRNLKRERTDAEIDKLTNRIWDRMQKEDTGTSLPRKEGMESFYGSPTEGKLGIVGEVAKSLFKQEPKTVTIKTNKEGGYELGEANYVGGTGVYHNGDLWAEFDTKKEAQDYIDKYNKLQSTQHSIDITPELKASVEGGQPLFKDAEAQYRIESGKNIVEAIKDFDGSPRATVALTHEIMHPTVVAIIDGAKEGNEVGAKHTKTIVDEYNKANPDKKITLEQMIEGNDAFINGRTTPEYRAVQEFIAEAWEKYHHEGAKGFSKAFQEVLDAITEVFRQVYKSLTGTTLTPELRKMFDELLGKENVSEVVKAPEISSKAKNKFSNLREKIKQKQSLKIVSDEAENRHANSKLTEADNPVQEPNVKALESEGENAKNAAQAENVIIKIDSIISAATDVGLRKVSDISTDEKRFQGRDKLNAEKVQEIAENWKDADQDPIHVWTDPKDGKTYVLSGHHRLAAAKQAGREKVKVIDRSKDFTEEQAIRFAKEEANANRTMETAIERANTLRQKRERGDTKDDINKFLDREGKNKNFVNNLSRLNPKGKTIEALRATEKSDDKVTQKEVEKIADWIGEARDRNKNLTDAHENELFDFLMDREGSKRITTKQDFLSKVNSLAGAMDFNANEPLNIARYKHKTEGEKLYDKEAETQKGKISDLQQRINEINDRIKNPNNPQYLNPDSKDYEEIKKNADNKLSELNTELQAESKALLDLYQQKGKFARQGTEQSSLFSTEKNETELPEDYYNDLRDIIKDLKDEHKGITLDEIKEIAKNELGEYYSEPDIEAAYKMTEPQPPKSAAEPPKSAPSRPDKSVLTNIVNAENTPPEVKKKLTAHGLKYDPESHDEALQIARAVIDSLGIDAAVTEARARNFGGAVNTFIQTEALNALYKKEAQAKTAQEKYEAAEKFAEVSIALDEWARGDAGRGISALATFYQKSPLGMVLKENKSRKEEFNQWAKGKEESWDEFLERLNKTPEFSDYVSEKVQTELREERKKERSKFFKKVDDTLDKWINDLESGNVAFSSVVPPKLIAEALKGVKAAFKVGESATKIIGDAIDYISDKIGDNWDKDTFRAKIEKALNLRAEKTSVDRYADSLKKQIEELQKQIDAGSRNKNQSNKRQLTPEEQSLLDEKKRLQKELNDIDPKTTFAQRIQKQIDDIQRQIDAGKRDEKERKNKKEYSEEEKELQEKLKAKKAELEALSPLKNTESYKLAELDKFREKLKGLSEAEKDEVVSKAYKKLLDNGALDHADLREIIAKATGRGNLTEKQAARLQELNETINAAEIAKQKHLKERTEQTLKEYHKAIDMAAKAKRDLANEFDKKTDYLKVISSSIQGNTLGLLNVAVMNPLYNITTHLALRLPIGTVQSLFGLALGKAEMNTVFGKPMQAEFFGKGGRGFREAFKGLLTGMNKADYESKEIFSSQIRPNRSLRALLGKDNREAKMKLQEKLFHTFSVFPGATAETNFRLLNFGDKPMRYSASAATAAAFAKKYGIKFNTMDWKTFMEFPREIVKEMELAKGKSLKEAEQEAEYVVRSIEKEGERSTMQQDNFFSDMLEKVFSGGKHEGAKSLAKTLTISPFVKIPSNVLWLGYNLVHPQIALAQAAAHTIRSYGYRGKGEIAESKLQMREARYWMSVTMMGAALQAVMIPLIKAGIITAANDEDDSKKKRIADLTYQPQGMFNMTKFWAYLSGKNVNEVQGGFEIPLKYFGLPGALGNSLARDYKQLTPEQKENRRLLTDNLLELFDADDFKDIENGIFSSSSSLLQGLKGGDMTYYAGNMVNLFTNLIQPAAVSEFSRAAIPYRISGKFDSLGDKIKNDLSNRSALFRKLTGKYPKGKRNIWGEIIKKDDSYANRYFGFNNVTKDNFAQFIYEDAQKWDDEDFLPPTVSNSLGGKKLTAEQLDELEENIGLARKEFIRAYTNDIALIEELGKNYSDILGRDAKKAALQYLYQKGRKLGVDMFVSKHPEFENVVSEEEKQVEELLKNFKEINLISEDEINEKIKH